MNLITTHARKLVYDLLDLMPSAHERASLKAMLTLFLQARGAALPEHAERKSSSALSRFLNLYDWPTRPVDFIWTWATAAMRTWLSSTAYA